MRVHVYHVYMCCVMYECVRILCVCVCAACTLNYNVCVRMCECIYAYVYTPTPVIGRSGIFVFFGSANVFRLSLARDRLS